MAGPESRRLDLGTVRQKRGVSLEQIAENTKISIRFLRAIEEEQFSKLPGGIFNTSYLRQYASAIGFDESRLIAHYRSNCPVADSDETPGPAKPRGGLLRWLTARV